MLYFSRWKTAAILGTALIVCLPALTNVLPAATFDSLPGWAQRKIELGMDLGGGVVLDVFEPFDRSRLVMH
jgi:preprotein translocase subunit SecD